MVIKGKQIDSIVWQKSVFQQNNSYEAKPEHKNATKEFDYALIADRLRTVSWSNYKATHLV